MDYLDLGNGSSAESIAFFREHRDRLGELVAAEVYFPGTGGAYPHCAALRDGAGNVIWLSGLAAGYPGEGPRAAMQVLVEAGFPAEQARTVFTERAVTLTRTPAPPGRPSAIAESRFRREPTTRRGTAPAPMARRPGPTGRRR